MATRSRSLLFLNFRNSYSNDGKRALNLQSQRDDNDNSEQAGLIGGYNTSEVVVEMTALPPRWVDIVEDIEETFSLIKTKIKLMEGLYKKNALPGFDNRSSEEDNIDNVCKELAHLFTSGQRKIKDLAKTGSSKQGETISKNIQNSLALRMQELSSKFRKSQAQFLKKLRKQEAKGVAVNFAFEEKDDDDENLDAVFSDAERAMLDSNENAITVREKEINDIARSIVTLSEVFRELQTMVIDQGSVLDRIDYQIEQTNVNMENAHKELQKAHVYQNSGNAANYCIVVLAIAVFIMFIFLYFKFKK